MVLHNPKRCGTGQVPSPTSLLEMATREDSHPMRCGVKGGRSLLPVPETQCSALSLLWAKTLLTSSSIPAQALQAPQRGMREDMNVSTREQRNKYQLEDSSKNGRK